VAKYSLQEVYTSKCVKKYRKIVKNGKIKARTRNKLKKGNNINDTTKNDHYTLSALFSAGKTVATEKTTEYCDCYVDAILDFTRINFKKKFHKISLLKKSKRATLSQK